MHSHCLLHLLDCFAFLLLLLGFGAGFGAAATVGAGFAAVFIVLAATTTAVGLFIRHALPALERIGGLIVLLLGLFLAARAIGFPWRARPVARLARTPLGVACSAIAGAALGAAWVHGRGILRHRDLRLARPGFAPGRRGPKDEMITGIL